MPVCQFCAANRMGEQGKAAAWVQLWLGHPTCTVLGEPPCSFWATLLLALSRVVSLGCPSFCSHSGTTTLSHPVPDICIHHSSALGDFLEWQERRAGHISSWECCEWCWAGAPWTFPGLCTSAWPWEWSHRLSIDLYLWQYTKIPILIRTFRDELHQCYIFWFPDRSLAISSDTSKIPWSILSIITNQCLLLLWQIFSDIELHVQISLEFWKCSHTCQGIEEHAGAFHALTPISLPKLAWKSLWEVTSSTNKAVFCRGMHSSRWHSKLCLSVLARIAIAGVTRKLPSRELRSDSAGLVVQWDRASGQAGRIFLWPYKPHVG